MEKMTQNDVRIMFDKIADSYDYMNNIISFFTHKFVRKIAINDLKIKNNSTVLDLCCGSGDFGANIKNGKVIGVDISSKMINIAKKKYPKNEYLVQNASELSLESNFFDYVVIGFGLRNIEKRFEAIKEIKRVLKSGGYFLHLDFSKKSHFNKIYNYFILCLAKIFVKDVEPYEYLISSKNVFYSIDELIDIFEQEGFRLIKKRDLLFKIISFQILQKI